jgi:serine protease Do
MSLVRRYIASAVSAFCGMGLAQTPAAPPKPAPVALQEFSASIEGLSSRVRRSVVQIFSTGYAPIDESDSTNASLLSKQHSTGSGVILSSDGYIVTNAHVVRGARRIQVRLAALRDEAQGAHSVNRPNGGLYEAKLVGQDRQTDLAVIKIDGEGLVPLTLADSDRVRQGQVVMAFGNPLGLEGSVSLGIVSSIGRQIKPDDAMVYLQTDAPINPGNSGGPLVDIEGRVIGINTFILTQSGGSEGLGFAIPSSMVRIVYGQIRKEGHVHRGRLGVYAQTITPAMAAGLELKQDWGVILGDVEPDGPADKAGAQVGDIVLTLDGKPMESARELEVAIYAYSMGQKATLAVLRGGDKLNIQIPVTERHDDPNRFADMVNPEDNLIPQLGILGVGIDKKLAELLPGLRNSYGVLVAAGSASDLTTGTDLQPGDVIYSVNGFTVTSVAALKKKLTEFKPGDAPALQIERDSRLMYVTIELQ